jgi:hypothetical protein
MSRKISATVAGLALAVTTLAVPAATAQTTDPAPTAVNVNVQQDADISEIDVNELLSYASADGTVVTPNETVTITPDYYDERLPLLNVYPLNDTFLQWDIALDRATGVITITAPAAPEEQVGTNIADYGEHPFRTRTNEGREVYFTLNFQPEKPATPEPEHPGKGNGNAYGHGVEKMTDDEFAQWLQERRNS